MTSQSAGIVRDRVDVAVAGQDGRRALGAPAGEARGSRRPSRPPGRGSRGSRPGRPRSAPARRPRRARRRPGGRAGPPASPTTHWARSLSGVQITTRSTRGSAAARAAAVARASSASTSSMPHTVTPRAARPSSTSGNWSRRTGLDPGAGLVARPEVVAERLDDACRWRRPRGSRRPPIRSSTERITPARRAAPVGGDLARQAQVVAEKLVRSVDQVHLHCNTMSDDPRRDGDTRAPGRDSLGGNRDDDPCPRPTTPPHPSPSDRDGAVVTLVLSRPERRNPLSLETMAALRDGLRDGRGRPGGARGGDRRRGPGVQRRATTCASWPPATRPRTSASSTSAPS